MRICFFGDSFVNGTGDPACLGWVGRVCRLARGRGHDLTCYDLGVRGDTTLDVAARWHEEAARRLKPEQDPRLMFSFGVNDACDTEERKALSVDTTLQAAGQILREACDLAPVLLIGPPPVAEERVNARVEVLSERLALLCAEEGVEYLEAFQPLRESAVWRAEVATVDGAHPGAAGYEEYAQLVDAWAPWRMWLP